MTTYLTRWTLTDAAGTTVADVENLAGESSWLLSYEEVRRTYRNETAAVKALKALTAGTVAKETLTEDAYFAEMGL